MLILASESPRRKELLQKLVARNDFLILPSNIDEHSLHITPSSLPKELSKLKAYSVFETHPEDCVLSCDTIVIHKDVIFGKPKDKEEAKSMLKALSNDEHVVISGYTFISKDVEINRTVVTRVYFNELSDELIDKYVASGSPLDKAGAYGIQDNDAFPLVKKIEGSLYNVIGLPLEDILKHCGRYLPLLPHINL